uniref:PKD domain-containing protein n=1 Tax=Erythrolobus australicus TaxID=1077150 RepID=A0A7S1XIH2_9RHOD
MVRRDTAVCPRVETEGGTNNATTDACEDPPQIVAFDGSRALGTEESTKFSFSIQSPCFEKWTLSFMREGDGALNGREEGEDAEGSVEHAFSDCGSYIVVLDAQDTQNRTTSSALAVKVRCAPSPTAEPISTASPTAIAAPAPCAAPSVDVFEVSRSVALGTPASVQFRMSSACFAKWEIDYGDGSEGATGESLAGETTHMYATCGTYVVELMGTDQLGRNTAVATREVEVQCPPPSPTATPAPCAGPPIIRRLTITSPLPANIGESVAFGVDVASDCLDYWILSFGDQHENDALGSRTTGTSLNGNRAHMYESCGTFRAQLEAKDALGRSSEIVTRLVTVSCPTPTPTPCAESPSVAVFEATSSVQLGERVDFSLQVSAPCGLSSWELAYGDEINGIASGTSGREASATASYEFPNCGFYVAELIVEDVNGARSAVAQRQITVSCPPTPSPTPTPCSAPVTEAFTLSPAVAPVGESSAFTWKIASSCLRSVQINFGDDRGASSIFHAEALVGSTEHVYEQCGEFTAQIVATDEYDRQSNVTERVVTVLCTPTPTPTLPPTATPLPTPTPCAPPTIAAFNLMGGSHGLSEPVTFELRVASNCIDSWALEFGDGTPVGRGSTTESTVSHSYDSCGTFTAELIASDVYSRRTAISRIQVTITCPTPTPQPLPSETRVECEIDAFVSWKLLCTVLSTQVPAGSKVKAAHMLINQSDEVTFTGTSAGADYDLVYQTRNRALPANWFAGAWSELEPFEASSHRGIAGGLVQLHGANPIKQSRLDMTPVFVQALNDNAHRGQATQVLFLTSQYAKANGFLSSEFFPIRSYCRVIVVLELEHEPQ